MLRGFLRGFHPRPPFVDRFYWTTAMRSLESRLEKLQDIVGTDVGDRGMKSLIVRGDLAKASFHFAQSMAHSVMVLSGFPCCVSQTPPTETDGPPGSCTICRAALALGYPRVVLVTDDCNAKVFAAAARHLCQNPRFSLETFPSKLSKSDEERMDFLAKDCGLVIACERAGPAKDGNCYTMRGVDMTAKGLVSPIHRLVGLTKLYNHSPFIAIGDGGNELGMGKVIHQIIGNPKIQNSDQIACVTAADFLIAASVSNWGGYALAAGAALCRGWQQQDVQEWIQRCLPSEQEEMDLLDRCVAEGCRDGVSGKVEAAVDGLPLATSLGCLRAIKAAALQ